MQQMCNRLKLLVGTLLKLSDKEASEIMGYSNPTTLWKIWRGETFPDAERLYMLANHKFPSKKVPNVDWIITGQGQPFSLNQENATAINKRKEMLKTLVEGLSDSKIDSILCLIDS